MNGEDEILNEVVKERLGSKGVETPSVDNSFKFYCKREKIWKCGVMVEFFKEENYKTLKNIDGSSVEERNKGDERKKEVKVVKPLSRQSAWTQKKKLTVDLRLQETGKGKLELQVVL